MLPKIDKYFKKAIQTSHKLDKVYSESDFQYKLNFDGCSKNNPGLAGAGAVIYHYDKEIWADDLFVGDMITNNYAEYAGLILGLQQAKLLGIQNLIVEGDSMLVINHMNGLYKCKSINLLELYDKAKELETHFNYIEYYHILRNKNKRADELSNIAVDKYLAELKL
jgi:ribonuclease HI